VEAHATVKSNDAAVQMDFTLKSRLLMTELDRMQIVENMFPDWKRHLDDGKVIDGILDGLTCREIVLNRCSRPGCNNVARRGRKTCMKCAAKAAAYMRTYGRRKAKNATNPPEDTNSDRKACGDLTTRLTM
jgi:hypothetical protein